MERVACGVVDSGAVVGCGDVSAGVMGARASDVGGVGSGVGVGGTCGDGVVRSAWSVGGSVGGSGVSDAGGVDVGELTGWDGDVGAVMYCGEEGCSRAKDRSMSWDWGSVITARG